MSDPNLFYAFCSRMRSHLTETRLTSARWPGLVHDVRLRDPCLLPRDVRNTSNFLCCGSLGCHTSHDQEEHFKLSDSSKASTQSDMDCLSDFGWIFIKHYDFRHTTLRYIHSPRQTCLRSMQLQMHPAHIRRRAPILPL